MTNVPRVLKLSIQYENHPYVEEFTKECNVVFIYRTCVLEGDADINVALSETWNFLQHTENPLPTNASVR